MAKITTVQNLCDRCKAPFERRNCFIIEQMSFQASGYDDRGSGGSGVKDKEFCTSCSRQFYEWFNGRAALEGRE